jgi:hypothetical protein
MAKRYVDITARVVLQVKKSVLCEGPEPTEAEEWIAEEVFRRTFMRGDPYTDQSGHTMFVIADSDVEITGYSQVDPT